jgi:hypothetical protein
LIGAGWHRHKLGYKGTRSESGNSASLHHGLSLSAGSQAIPNSHCLQCWSAVTLVEDALYIVQCRLSGISESGNGTFTQWHLYCKIDRRCYLTGSGSGPIPLIDTPTRTSLISQVGSPDPHAVHRHSTRHLISKRKRISLHQEMDGTVQYIS